MNFDKLFSFEGRASRREFWLTTLSLFCLFWSMAPLLMLAALLEVQLVVVALLMIIPFGCIQMIGAAVTVRRMHGLNKSGWFALLGPGPERAWLLRRHAGTK
jgi:uncharacterized membrane protein YhaH (DUF805 family)